MTKIRLLSLLLSLSLSLTALAQTNAAADRPLDLTQDHAPEVMPLRLKEPKLITGLQLYARSHQVLDLALVNVSDKPVEVVRIIPTCPCLKVLDDQLPATLAPQAAHPIRIRIDGRRIKPGPFSKTLYVKLKDERFGAFSLEGEVRNMIACEPAMFLDLGESGGLTPWTRTFTVRTLFEQDLKLKLQPTKEPFDVRMEQVAPKEYRVTVSPKLPLPIRRYRASFELTTDAVKDYGPVTVGVLVNVKELVSLALQTPRQPVSKVELAAGKPQTAVFTLTEAHRRRSTLRGSRSRDDDHDGDDWRRAEDPLAQKEEKDAWPLTELATWQKMASTISAKELPQGVSMKAEATKAGAIRVAFTVQPGALKEDANHLRVTLRHNGQLLGNAVIYAK
ncbi:MAG: hypothetical protein ACI4WT_04445 [Oligosphaeraceae bacterium]